MSTALTGYEANRALRDVQSRMSALDHKLSRIDAAFTPPGATGAALVAKAASLVARHVGNHAAADRLELKAAVSPAMTTVPGWAADIAVSGLPGFVLALAPLSALAAVLQKSPQVSLIGVGSRRVPVAGAPPAAKVVGEGAPIPLAKPTLSALVLAPFKLAAILTYTDEMARASDIEAVTRTLLSQSVAAGLDIIAFGTTPPALLSGVTPITASAATDPATALREDLRSLVAALTAPSADVVFVMSPPDAVYAASLLPPSFVGRIAPSSAVPAGTVIAVDPQATAAALPNEPRFLLSESAVLHEEETPLPIATGAQGSGVIATPSRSLFQTDTLALRCIADAAFGARPGGVSWLEDAAW